YKSIQILPDLYLAKEDVTVSEPNVFEGQSAYVAADVQNIGPGDAENVLVKFYTTDMFLGYDIVNVSTGSTSSASVSWQPPVGTHIVYVEVDPGNRIAELNENNNLMSKTQTVLLEMDLSVELELDGSETGKVLITATVQNQGNSDANLVRVDIFNGDPEAGGLLINSKTYDILSGGGTEVVSFDWETTAGTKTVYVVVDDADVNKETDETNNIQTKTVNVKGEKAEEADLLPIIIIVIVVIAVPTVIIIYYWRKRLAQ
ncbi:MAG: hypothetical protein JSV56_04300, partial [Methanomassiliicoccales archaeon]